MSNFQAKSGHPAMPHGSIVAIVTPMTAKGEIHWENFESLIEWHIQEGTNGIVVAGTTGECATFSIEEQSKLFEHAVAFVKGRIAVIAGTGANNTIESIELTQAALAAGADATLTVVPYYNKPSQEGLYQHFMATADSTAIPQILYNVPSRTGCDLSNETILRLARHPRIAGLKDATGDLVRIHHLVSDLAGEPEGHAFKLYSGDDMSSLAFMRLGGHGCISVTANIKPGQMAQMCGKALKGDFSAAAKIDQELRFWHKNLFIESSPAPTKYALWKSGQIQTPELRLPLVRLSDQCARVLDQVL